MVLVGFPALERGRTVLRTWRLVRLLALFAAPQDQGTTTHSGATGATGAAQTPAHVDEPVGLDEDELDEFEAFFAAHQPDLVGYLWRMTADEQTARDLAQEAFVRAWQHYTQIRAYDHPKAWLFRVATHLALNLLRTQASRRQASSSWPEAQREAQSDPALRIIARDAVLRTLQELVPRDRAALVLHAVYGLTCAELASILGLSLSSTKVTLWRARERFRARYTVEEDSR
jgi:RNA polymerase sigma-70 factor (ECF subfamily)